MEFIEGLQGSGCIFCLLPKEKNDAENLILYRSSHAFVIMNLYPYNSAHVMVAPFEHVSSLSNLSEQSLFALSRLTKESLKIIEKLFSPDGVNVGMNIGKAAGAGFVE
ncbi:MAG: HIT domain-containing protein, partial [Nitrospinota bacterium]